MRCAIVTIVVLALWVNTASAQTGAFPNAVETGQKPVPAKPTGSGQAAEPGQKTTPAKPATPAKGATPAKKPVPVKRIPPARNTAPGLTTSLLVHAGMLVPAERAYSDVYGYGPVLSGELRVALKPWKGRLVASGEGSYRSRRGSLTFTREPTTVEVLDVGAGLLVRLSRRRLSPYAGAGVTYLSVDERSAALGAVSQGKVGAMVAGGLAMRVTGRIAFDARVKYTTCRMRPAELEVDVGGLTADVGIGLRF